jgi:hypothetical protein
VACKITSLVHHASGIQTQFGIAENVLHMQKIKKLLRGSININKDKENLLLDGMKQGVSNGSTF